MSIHIIGFFSNITFYTLHIKPGDGGRFKVGSFAWEKKAVVPQMQEGAKEHPMALLRGHLDCDLEALPEYELSQRDGNRAPGRSGKLVDWGFSAALSGIEKPRKGKYVYVGYAEL
ncbi:hypothetical protein GGTG_11644 [Gaeumannomyces tritici R3-111a-1]|uniref:Uncharacterized protein n=1 Tax=Gaeumannomyces tritici (strain R3-111a-1) TaxID=644352 RepID=J3PDS1_GAET3|nr:hypothetical protein GGTG_11644 [Gaeumannomyces tritici R3-111a-1]EJT70621.1 hypothetical protein GGTG_11644 [Gaeumannomyces tritici R3-111a-1]